MRKAIRSSLLLLCATVIGAQSVPAQAYSQTYYHARLRQQQIYRQEHPVKAYFARHPKVKAATIGAGVGAGAGALTGLVAHTGIARGAMIGAGTGAGVGLIRSSRTLKRHPIFRDVATAGVAGLGLGWAARRHGGAMPGLVVGSAVGLGIGLIAHGL
jgi:hypothetical protein